MEHARYASNFLKFNLSIEAYTDNNRKPCTVRDFMNYLKYIEIAPENLQFYLWFQDYCTRFDKLPGSEKVLSPEWTQAQAEAEAAGNTAKRSSNKVNPEVAQVLKDTDFAGGKPKTMMSRADPFETPEKTPSLEEKRDAMSEYGSSSAGERTTASSAAHRNVADHAFDEAGMKWKPCTNLSSVQ